MLVELRRVINDTQFSNKYWLNQVEIKWNENCKDVANIEHILNDRDIFNNMFVDWGIFIQ